MALIIEMLIKAKQIPVNSECTTNTKCWAVFIGFACSLIEQVIVTVHCHRTRSATESALWKTIAIIPVSTVRQAAANEYIATHFSFHNSFQRGD